MHNIVNAIDYVFKRKDFPKWVVYLNNGSLAGILIWPIVILTSIMMFDHPKDVSATLKLVLIVDCYPLYVILLSFFSYKIFPYSKVTAGVLASIPLAAYLSLVVMALMP